jgi:hypothetical protein
MPPFASLYSSSSSPKSHDSLTKNKQGLAICVCLLVSNPTLAPGWLFLLLVTNPSLGTKDTMDIIYASPPVDFKSTSDIDINFALHSKHTTTIFMRTCPLVPLSYKYRLSPLRLLPPLLHKAFA